MKLNIQKLNEIYNTEGPIKEILKVLFEKAIDDGDSGFKQLFYGFGFYEFEDGEIEDDEEVLNLPLLLSMNDELRSLILNQIRTILDRSLENQASPFFEEFLNDSKFVIPFKKYKKIERKAKLNEIEKN